MERSLWTDERIDDLVERIEKRFDEVDRRFDRLELRMDRLEADMVALRRDMHTQFVVVMTSQVTGFLTLAGIMVAKL